MFIDPSIFVMGSLVSNLKTSYKGVLYSNFNSSLTITTNKKRVCVCVCVCMRVCVCTVYDEKRCRN